MNEQEQVVIEASSYGYPSAVNLGDNVFTLITPDPPIETPCTYLVRLDEAALPPGATDESREGGSSSTSGA